MDTNKNAMSGIVDKKSAEEVADKAQLEVLNEILKKQE